MERYGKSFKELNFREKCEHIWQYYRWPILATVVAVFISIYFIKAILTPKQVYTVDVTISGKIYYDETHADVVKQFKDRFDTNLSVASVNWENVGEFQMAMMQKIPLLVRTKELDILGLPESAFNSYMGQMGEGMFVALDTLPEFKELLEERKDRLYVSEYTLNEDNEVVQGDGHVYGIRVSKFKNIPSVTESEEIILGVTSTYKNPEDTVEMLRYLSEE